jgi:hypothetical protein
MVEENLSSEGSPKEKNVKNQLLSSSSSSRFISAT